MLLSYDWTVRPLTPQMIEHLVSRGNIISSIYFNELLEVAINNNRIRELNYLQINPAYCEMILGEDTTLNFKEK